MLAALAIQGGSFLASRYQAHANSADTAQAQSSRRLSTKSRKEYRDKLLTYFADSATKLLRPAEGVLRYPSISPSLPNKQYSTQLWDWDTYWTARGLFRLAKLSSDRDLRQRLCEHAQGSLQNFFDHQSEEGRIPIMIDVKDADPFGCLKTERPLTRNQAKPVMAQLALLVADEQKEVEWFAPQFEGLLRFYESWTLKNLSSIGLLVWADDVAIGDDNDPTTFGRPFFSSANLLLNCLYYQDLRAAAELARRLKRSQEQRQLSDSADALKERIQQYCWDPRDRFFYTVDVQCVDRRAELIPNIERGMPMSWKCLPLRIQMFTSFLPLWCGVATSEQAADLVHLHYGNDDFRAAWGVRSLSNKETMYSLVPSSNPSDWLGPVWIIVNYLVWKGLQAYGFGEEATELADKTVNLLASDLTSSGTLNEYYHPDTGAPLSHQGFMDWNLLVLEMVDMK